jgi:6-phosphogluconolactonase (cycloisomerase 2 family)
VLSLVLGFLGCASSPFCPDCDKNTAVTGLNYQAATTSPVGSVIVPILPHVQGGVPTAFTVIDGALPPGLALDPVSGIISGIPTAPGAFEATIQAGNSAGTTSESVTFFEEPTSNLALAYNSPQAYPAGLSIPTQAPTLNAATLGISPSEARAAKPAALDAPSVSPSGYSFTLSAGALPPGLTLATDGSIGGSPTVPGVYTFTITASNGATTAAWTLSYTVTTPDSFTLNYPSPAMALTGNLPGAATPPPVVSNPVSGATITFAVSGGTLPPGITLNPDGSFQGTPANPGAYPITITATEGTQTSAFSVLITVLPSISASALAPSTSSPLFGAAVTLNPTFSGGTATIGTAGPGSSDVAAQATSGSTVPSNAITSATTFTLTVTNAAGATATATCLVTPQAVNVTAIQPAANTVTAGGADAFTATVTGGATGLVTWSASGGSFTGNQWTAPGLPGTYTITATSMDDPTRLLSIPITVVAADSVPTVTAPGFVTAGLTGALAQVAPQPQSTYAWSITGGTIQGSTTGTSVSFTPGSSGSAVLSCRVTNAAGTTAAPGTATCVIAPAPVANVTAPASVTGNLAGYTASVPLQAGSSYAWTVGSAAVTAGAGTNTITFTPGATGPVTFSVVVTNEAGTASAPGTATSAVLAAPMATVTAPAKVTAGLAGYTASVPAQAGSSYAWSVGSATVTAGAGTSSITFTPAATGQVTFSVIVTNSLGSASAPGTGASVIEPAPVATVTAPVGVTANLAGYTASVPLQAGSSYAWTVGSATVTAGAGTNTITFTPGPSGPVSFSVVVTNAAGTASAPGTASSAVLAAPVATITAPASVTGGLAGYTASVPAQAGASYAWTVGSATVTAGAGTNSITFTPAGGGTVTFNVIVSNSLGTASSPGTATSAIVAAPVATITAPAGVTGGQGGYTASVPAQAGASYAWTVGSATVTAGAGTNSITFTPAASGTVTFSVIVTNSLGAASNPGTATSSIVAAPVATITAPASVTGGLAGCTASVPVQAGASYAWTVGSATVTAGAGTSSITFTPAASGTVTLSVIVTNSLGAVSSPGTATSAIVAAPVATVTAPANVSASLAGYTASVPAQSGASYAWTVGSATVTAGAGTNSITFTPAASGTVTFSVVVTNSLGTASAPGTATANIVGAPVATVTAPASVTGGLAGYTASVPAQSGASYAWTVGSATVTAGTGTNSITFTPAATGTVTFSVVVTNALGVASSPGTASSAIVPAPVATVTAPASVTGSLAGYTASVPAQSGASCSWTVGSATVTAGAGTNSITFTPAASGTVTFSVVVTNSLGTASSPGTASSAIVAAPVATVTAPSLVTANLAGYTASVPAQTGATYAWTVGSATVTAGAGTHSITFTPAGSGTVTFSVVVSNSLGTASSPGTASSTIVAAPAISAFAANPTSITVGSGSILSYTFTGGTGSVNNSIGAVTSGGSTNVTPGTTTTYTLSVTNTAGTVATDTATVTVTAVPAPSITAFTGNPTTISAGQGTILAFTFANGTGSIDNGVGTVTSGGSIAVSPSATTTYTLTVTGTGAPATSTVTVTVKSFVSKWLYVANDADNSLSCFTLDDTTGLLTRNGADVSLGSGGNARNVCSDPLARFVFATDPGSSTVSAFLIDQTHGTLTLATGSPVTVPVASPWGAAVDPTGSYLYVRCDGAVVAYGINGATGALTHIGTYATGKGAGTSGNPDNGDITVHPSGTYLFSAGQCYSEVDVFALDPANGTLSGDAAYATLGNGGTNGPIGVAVNPTGAYVAVKGELQTSYITTYSFDINTGALSSPTQSTALPGYNAYNGLCFSPTLDVLYTAFYFDTPASVGAFGINLANGVLTALSGSPYTWFTGPTSANFTGSDNITVSRNGKWAYATDWSDAQIGFGAVDTSTGALPASATFYAAGNNPDCITIVGVLQ